jgi:hypothetical protein
MTRQRKSKPTEPPTPEQVFSIIANTPEGDGHWHLQLWHLLLSRPNPIGRMILDFMDCDLQIRERLEGEVERHVNRKPDDPEADEILALKQRMSWSRLAEYLSKKEGRKVSVDNARKRYDRARNRKGRIGTYAVEARRRTV